MLIENHEAASQLIEMQIKDIENIITKTPYGFEYTFWEDFTAKILDRIYGNESAQRHGFEQAGHGDCYSVFESYSEHQRREDFIEILNLKKEYLENLVRDMKSKGLIDGQPVEEEYSPNFYDDLDLLLKSGETSPLDHTVAEILSGIKDPSLLKEARKNLLELREELLKAAPSWKRIKEPLTWLIGFGRKEYFLVLPFVVVYHKKIID